MSGSDSAYRRKNSNIETSSFNASARCRSNRKILQTRSRRAHVVERDCIVSTRVFEAAETKQQPRSSCGAGRCPFECGPRPRDTIGQIPAAWEVEPKAENEVETDDPAERPIRR
jgi:hypothetical protein